MNDLSALGLKPTTLACLRRAGINIPYRLHEHTCRELIWHSEVTPEALYDVLCALRQHDRTLKATTIAQPRPLSKRDLEVFRLRVVEGHTLQAIGERFGIGHERVRQILVHHFGLRGEPPAVKAQARRGRSWGASVDCVQAGRAIARVRAAKGLTIEQLAADAELSTEQLARIEDGLRDPTWTTLARLAVGLDTTTPLLAHAIEVEKP
jgi:DNA-binding XRE family transcriptional regulator